MKKRVLSLTIIFILILEIFCVGQSFAAVSASLSGGGTYKPGDTVTMKLKFSGATFGAVEAKVSYDSSILSFSSCSATYNTDSNTIVMSTASSSELSCTLVFKAGAEGSTKVSVTTVEGATADLESFSASTYANITVKKPESSTNNGSGSSSTKPVKPSKPADTDTNNNRGEFNEESEGVPQEQPKRPEEFVIDISGVKYVIVEKIKASEIPEGFVLAQIKYDGWEVPAVINEEKGITLLYLKNRELGEKDFFVYDASSQKFGKKVNVELDEYLEYLELREAGTGKAPVIIAGIALLAAMTAVGLQIARMKGYNPFNKE